MNCVHYGIKIEKRRNVILKMMSLLLTAAFLFVGCGNSEYKAACEAFVAGDFEGAQKGFSEIDEGYKDVKYWKSFFEYVETSEFDINDTTNSLDNEVEGLWEQEGGETWSELDVEFTAQDACIANFVNDHADEMKILMENGAFSEVAQPSLLRQADFVYKMGEVGLLELKVMEENEDLLSSSLISDLTSTAASMVADSFETAKVRYEMAGDEEKAALCEGKIQEIIDQYGEEVVALRPEEQDTGFDIPSYNADDTLEEGEYWCMGKNDTCTNKTSSAYDLYCSSCDPDGDNIEG